MTEYDHDSPRRRSIRDKIAFITSHATRADVRKAGSELGAQLEEMFRATRSDAAAALGMEIADVDVRLDALEGRLAHIEQLVDEVHAQSAARQQQADMMLNLLKQIQVALHTNGDAA